MSDPAFPHLFQPLKIRGRTLKNRIMSTGHDTCLPDHGKVNDAYIAYQERRAAGGVGLIVTQVAGVHETARYTSHLIMATTDDCLVTSISCCAFSLTFPTRTVTAESPQKPFQYHP